MLIRCTQKLQKEMGLKKSDLSEVESQESTLGSWHANLIHINRRKCVLFVNDKTLFNFIAPDISKKEIKELSSVFRGYLSCVLLSEGVPEEIKEQILIEYQEIRYSSTNSKSVLGSMNDLSFHYKDHILSGGGVHCSDVPTIIHKLNNMPMGAIEYKYASEALRESYEAET